ncbi:MAG: hypothetical protein AB9869_10570 [Verrucomicrobiia bacterium]
MKTLMAAASQRRAASHLAWAASGVGSVLTDWFRRLELAKTDAEREKILPKVILRCWRIDGGQRLLEDADPAMRTEILRRQAELFARDARIFGRKKAASKWSVQTRVTQFKQSTVSDRIAAQMASNWLRGGPGVPGYAFFRDPVLATIINAQTGFRLTAKEVHKICGKRLGLKKGPIRIVSVKADKEDHWRFRDANGKIHKARRLGQSPANKKRQSASGSDDVDISPLLRFRDDF